MKYLTLSIFVVMVVGCGTTSTEAVSEPIKEVSEGLYMDDDGNIYSVEYDANGNPLPIIGESEAGPYIVNFDEIYPIPMPMGDG